MANSDMRPRPPARSRAGLRRDAAHAAVGGALLVLTMAPAGYAQAPAEEPAEANSANVVSYPAEYFTSSRPNTALDMVRRAPGFTYTPGKQDVRGLSGAAGNVVIDGQPQTSKTVTLDETLNRIPANQVARIDIVRGGAGGIEMSGYPVVANVVRISGARSQATAQVEPRFYGDGAAPQGSARLDMSRSQGDLSMSGAIDIRAQRMDDGGEGRIVRTTPAGALIDAGDFIGSIEEKAISTSGALEYRAGDTLYRANVGYSHLRNDRNEIAYLAAREHFLSEEDTDNAEIGANVERRLLPWLTGRVDALQTFEDKTRYAGRLGRATTTESTAGETSLRGVLSMRRWEGLSFEAGVEGAFNFLDQESELATANANIRVEERRTQPFVTMNWQASPRLSLELGARYETSTISQTGDTNSERTLGFFKPRAIAIVSLTDKTQLRLRVERDVRQLDFGDFAASSGLQEGSASAGNAGLQPERAWVYEAVLEQKLWDRAVAVLTYTHEEVRETRDYKRLSPTADGRGNIGEGTRDVLLGDFKIGLDALGLKGMRIEANPQYYMSEVVDPFTGATRPISGYNRWRGRMTFYVDRPEINSTFGAEYLYGNRENFWRIDQVQYSAQHALGHLFWEWTPAPGLSVRTNWYAVTDRERHRDRDVYAGPRGTSPLSFREDRFVARGSIYTVRIRKAL